MRLLRWGGFALLVGLLLSSGVMAQVEGGPSGQLLYSMRSEEGSAVHLFDIATGTDTRLVEGQTPAWSPDETQFLYVDSAGQIALAAPDGTQSRTVTALERRAIIPAWSPDGMQIAYSMRTEAGDLDVFAFTVDDAVNESAAVRLTDDPGRDSLPQWSPDGTQMVFSSERDTGNYQLYLLELDSGTVSRLTMMEDEAVRGQWSPDGESILFTSRPVGSSVRDYDLLLLDVATGTIQALTDNARSTGFTWSPDGKYIAMTQFVTSDNEDDSTMLVIIDLEGEVVLELATFSGTAANMSWRAEPQPDTE